MFRTAAHAIKDAHNEQPNDRERQSDQDKCHHGTDKHREHAISPDFLFLHFDPARCRGKKGRESRLATNVVTTVKRTLRDCAHGCRRAAGSATYTDQAGPVYVERSDAAAEIAAGNHVRVIERKPAGFGA
jgi:hypothetical protein